MFRDFAKTKVAAIALLSAVFAASLWGQTKSSAVIVSGSDVKWTHEAADPPDTENVVLRMDQSNGSMELLVRFPGGHVFKLHWHESNERIIVLEGRLAKSSTSRARPRRAAQCILVGTASLLRTIRRSRNSRSEEEQSS
jgi:hypothetical protein